jgi:hypothetical protein
MGIAYQPRVQNPGNPARQKNPRSEGTPHSRAPRNVFLVSDRIRRSGFRAIVLINVARRPSVKARTNVPSDSGGLAACVVVSDPRPEGSGARANVSSSSAFISGFFFYFLLSSPTPSFPPSLCGVLKKHTSSLGCGSQGWHPGLVCVTPTRANGTTAFRSRIHALP